MTVRVVATEDGRTAMRFEKLVFTPSGSVTVTLAVAACRAGATGVVNFELGGPTEIWSAALDRVAAGASRYLAQRFGAERERGVDRPANLNVPEAINSSSKKG